MNNFDRFTLEDLSALWADRNGLGATIYMPAHRSGAEVRQNRIRFRNLMRRTEEILESKGKEAEPVWKSLESGAAKIDNDEFWQAQSDGLAVFAAPGFFARYRVPQSFGEAVYVHSGLHLTPLLPIVCEDGRFAIFALSEKQAKLFECSRFSIQETAVEGMPASLEDALKYDDPQKSLQNHSAGRDAIFHGQGRNKDASDDRMLRYVRLCARVLEERFAGSRTPVVLAAVAEHAPVLREAGRDLRLVEETMTGNPDGVAADALLERAWPVVEPLFAKRRGEYEKRCRQHAGDGKVSVNIEEIVPAAAFGRVEALLVDPSAEIPGRWDGASETAHVSNQPTGGEEDLVNRAVLDAWRKGAEVYNTDPEKLPAGSRIAALFRY